MKEEKKKKEDKVNEEVKKKSSLKKHEKHEKKSEKNEKVLTKPKNSAKGLDGLVKNPAMLTLVAFVFTIVVVIITWQITINLSDKQKEVSIEKAVAKIESFVKEDLVVSGTEVVIKEASEESGIYKITLEVGPTKQKIDSYVTKDGEIFFPQGGMKISEVKKEIAEAKKGGADQEKAPTPVTEVKNKTDKPKVELFVMSFCPYGVGAEKTMAPVYELLKDKADINIRFIASVDGEDINKVKSLHGAIEGIEDARQLCIVKNYNEKTLWKYLAELNKKCYPIYRDGEDVYKECWQTAAKNAGMNVAKLEKCVESEGVALINKESEASKKYGVTGSPSLIINGEKINATRTPEGYKKAICSAFKNQPAECKTELEELPKEDKASAGGCN